MILSTTVTYHAPRSLAQPGLTHNIHAVKKYAFPNCKIHFTAVML